MILGRDTPEVSGGGVGTGGVFPPRKDIGRHEGRSGQDKYKYIPISDIA